MPVPPGCGWCFCSQYPPVFGRTNVFDVDEVWCVSLFFYGLCFRCPVQNTLADARSQRYFSAFWHTLYGVRFHTSLCSLGVHGGGGGRGSGRGPHWLRRRALLHGVAPHDVQIRVAVVTWVCSWTLHSGHTVSLLLCFVQSAKIGSCGSFHFAFLCGTILAP